MSFPASIGLQISDRSMFPKFSQQQPCSDNFASMANRQLSFQILVSEILTVLELHFSKPSAKPFQKWHKKTAVNVQRMDDERLF